MKICLIVDVPQIGGASIAAKRTFDAVEEMTELSMIASNVDQGEETPFFCLQPGEKFKIFEHFGSRILPFAYTSSLEMGAEETIKQNSKTD